jgi:urea transport system substrate-binding protein
MYSKRWVAVWLLLVVLIVGCTFPLQHQQTKATVVFAGEPIKVGLLHSLSGSLALSEIPVRNAELLAIQQINYAGGVLGRKVVPILADGESSPQVFAAEARRLLHNHQVDALFGCWTSSSRKAVLPVLEQEGGILWYPTQYEGMEQSPHVFYMGATANQQIVPAIAYLIEQGKQQFFLIGSDYVFPRTANKIVQAQLAHAGLDVVGEMYVPLGGKDFDAVIERIKAEQPDVVFNTLNGDSNLVFFRALYKAGLTATTLPVMSVSIAESEVRAIGIEKMLGHLAAWSYFQTVPTPQNEQFVQAYRYKFGERALTSDPQEAAYLGVHLWAKAVEAAGTTDWQQVAKAARILSFDAPEGRVQLRDNQHLAKIARIGRIRDDGLFDVVWQSKTPIEPDPFLAGYEWADGQR